MRRGQASKVLSSQAPWTGPGRSVRQHPHWGLVVNQGAWGRRMSRREEVPRASPGLGGKRQRRYPPASTWTTACPRRSRSNRVCWAVDPVHHEASPVPTGPRARHHRRGPAPAAHWVGQVARLPLTTPLPAWEERRGSDADILDLSSAEYPAGSATGKSRCYALRCGGSRRGTSATSCTSRRRPPTTTSSTSTPRSRYRPESLPRCGQCRTT